MRLTNLWNPLAYYARHRKRYLLKRFSSVGDNFLFDPLSSILTPQKIEIGNNVFIGERAHISAELKIGNNVMFGPRPVIIGGDHYFAVKGKSVRFLHPQAGENSEPILIEDEVWCGASVLILGSVVLGMGCVVGAGSVVSRSIPPYTVAVGNPCRPIRLILDTCNLQEHLRALGYPESLAENIVARRQSELSRLNLNNLPVVDKSGEYWETKS